MYASLSYNVLLVLASILKTSYSLLSSPNPQLHQVLNPIPPGQLSDIFQEGHQAIEPGRFEIVKRFMFNIESVFCTLLNNSKCLHKVKIR